MAQYRSPTLRLLNDVLSRALGRAQLDHAEELAQLLGRVQLCQHVGVHLQSIKGDNNSWGKEMLPGSDNPASIPLRRFYSNIIMSPI